MPVTIREPQGLPARTGNGDADWSEMLKTQLSDTRTSAENWRNGLVAIIGLIATVTIVKGPSEIDGLVKPAAYAVGILLLLALACAVIGTWSALRAAYGEPTVISRESLDRSGGATGHRFVLATKAIVDLKIAQRTTLLTVGLLVLAIAVTWYGPRPSSPVVVQYGTSSVCGYIERARNGELEIRPASGAVVHVKLSDVAAVRLVDNCNEQ
jgi:hypothetical protein